MDGDQKICIKRKEMNIMAKNVTKTLKLATVIDDCKMFSYNSYKDIYEKYMTKFDYKYIETKELEIGFYNIPYIKSHNVNGIDIERHDKKTVCVFLYKVSVPENIFMQYGNIWCTEADALRSDVISRVLGGENTYEAAFINPDTLTLSKFEITAKSESDAKREAKNHAKQNGLTFVKCEIKATTETGENSNEPEPARRYGMKHETFISLAQKYGTMERV